MAKGEVIANPHAPWGPLLTPMHPVSAKFPQTLDGQCDEHKHQFLKLSKQREHKHQPQMLRHLHSGKNWLQRDTKTQFARTQPLPPRGAGSSIMLDKISLTRNPVAVFPGFPASTMATLPAGFPPKQK